MEESDRKGAGRPVSNYATAAWYDGDIMAVSEHAEHDDAHERNGIDGERSSKSAGHGKTIQEKERNSGAKEEKQES